MAKQVVRFAVRSEDETHRSSSWKCFAQSDKKDDVYLLCRELGNSLHISFHESKEWHVRFDLDFLKKNAPPDSHLLKKSFTDSWEEPPELGKGSGTRLMYQICVPYTALVTPISEREAKKLTWIPSPPNGKCQEIAVLCTEEDTKVTGWPCQRSMGTKLVGDFQLSISKRRIWVVHRVIEMPKFGDHSGAPTYFGGATGDSLKQYGLKALSFGKNEDGSRWIVEARIEDKRDRAQDG